MAVALGVLVLVGAVILQGDADERADGSQPHPLAVGAARGALGERVQHRRERLGREGCEPTEAAQDDGDRQLLPLEGASERKEARGDSVRRQMPVPRPRRSRRALDRRRAGAHEAEKPITLRRFLRVMDAWPRGRDLALRCALGALP